MNRQTMSKILFRSNIIDGRLHLFRLTFNILAMEFFPFPLRSLYFMFVASFFVRSFYRFEYFNSRLFSLLSLRFACIFSLQENNYALNRKKIKKNLLWNSKKDQNLKLIKKTCTTAGFWKNLLFLWLFDEF